MAEFAAALVGLSEAGLRIGGALRDLIKTMKDAEDEINHIIMKVSSHTFVTQHLSENIERYSKSQSFRVQGTHSQLRVLIDYCRPIYEKVEHMLKPIKAPVGDAPSSAATRLAMRTRALWTYIKPKLDENVNKLGDVREMLQACMDVLQLDFACCSNQQRSPLQYVRIYHCCSETAGSS